MPGAPLEPIVQALLTRGATSEQKGCPENAIADYTRVIELADAPLEAIAEALHNRGLAWRNKGDSEKEIADYTRLIEMVGAPVEQVALAFLNRGRVRYEKKGFQNFLSDTQAAWSKDPTIPEAGFNLGLTLLACGRDEDALSLYRHAASRFPESTDSLGISDLTEAENTWLTTERALPIRRAFASATANPFHTDESGGR